MKRPNRTILVSTLIFVCLLNTVFTPATSLVMAQSPTDIGSVSDLIGIRDNLAGNYILTADIDLGSVLNWTPLGDGTTAFTGSLDGGGHTIRHLAVSNTLSTTVDQGLFGVIGVGGSVTDLNIEAATITAANATGILAGENRGTVARVSVQGIVSGATDVGGLVGINSGKITDASAIGSVSGANNNGGLVGSNSGTLTNTYAAATVSGAVTNTYVQFDGISDYISIPHNSAYVTSSFTLEAWFNWTSSVRSATQFITSKGLENYDIHTGGGSGTDGIRFIPVLRGATTYDDPRAYQDAQNVLQPGWNHVATIWDYSKQQVQILLNGIPQHIFQNGVDVGTVAPLPLVNPEVNPLASNTNEFFIGARNDPVGTPTLFFQGNIADVRFWNKVLTPAEIAADKDKQLTGNEPGLIGYWKLTEASGDTVYDSSSYHNNGTIHGATRVTTLSVNGGLVAVNTGTVSTSFYDSDVSGLSDTGKGVPLSTTGMQTSGTFTSVGWSIPGTWKINDGNTYPSLFEHLVKVSLTSISPSTSVSKQSYTANYTVAGDYIGKATGSVTVDDGETGACTASLTVGSPSSGSCSLTSSSAGSKTLTASYDGDSVFASATGTAVHSVDKASTTTSINSDANDPSKVGESYTVSVTVSAVSPGSGTPTGSVDVDDGDGATCTITTLSGGSGSCDLTSTTAGAKTIIASYKGDSNYNTSTGTTAHAVDMSDTSTTIISDENDPSKVGEAYSVNVTVAAISPGTGTLTGSVTVSDGSGASCTIAALSSGSGSCDLTSTTQGSKTLTASYAGDSNFNSSSGTTSHSVNQAQTQVTLASHTPDPASLSETVIFTVSVAAKSPATGTPGGTVEILEGSDIVCSGTLSAGQATCTSDDLTAGVHTLSARYNGSTEFAGSTGASFTQSVGGISLSDNATSTAHTVVGSFSTSVSSSPYIYSLETSGPVCTASNSADNASFTVDGSNLERLSGTGSGTYSICVQSADKDGGTVQTAFSITINNPPTLDGSSLSRLTVGAAGTNVGAVTVTDGRSPFSYRLASNGATCTPDNSTGNSSFSFTDNMLDRKADTAVGDYKICIEVEDAGHDKAQYAYTIQVIEGPSGLALSRTTVSSAQTVVGTFSASGSLSPLTYTLETTGSVCGSDDNSADNAKFSVSGSELNRAPGTSSGSYKICAQVSEGDDLTQQKAFTIQVTDPPSALLLSNPTVSNLQDLVGTVSATGGLSPLTFSLETSGSVCTAGDAGDNALFSIMGNGLLRSSSAVPGSYTICLQVQDGNGETYQKEFAITVSNDTGVPSADWTVELSADKAIDGDTIGTVVGSLHSTISGTTYALVDATAFPYESYFVINSKHELILTGTLSLDSGEYLPIRIRATAPNSDVKDLDVVIKVMKKGTAAGASATNDNSSVQDGSTIEMEPTDNDQMSTGATSWVTLEIVRYPAHGSAQLGSIIYTPEPGFSGTDSATYRACDNLGFCIYGEVTFVVSPDPKSSAGDSNPLDAKALPATGFAPDVVTHLAQQPDEKRYGALPGSEIRLQIPRLGVDIPITGVPLVDGTWDVTWLGNKAGWLQGSSFPGWAGNSALAAHVTGADGLPGPFAKLSQLQWGDQVIIIVNGERYIYEIRESYSDVRPNDLKILHHETLPWLTLITCEDYNPAQNTYKSRTVLRAVLIKTE